MSFPNSPTPVAWQPPQGYVQVASALDGVIVFAPQPEAPKAEAPTSYQCPNCGAATRYDISAGGVACEHCGYVAPAKAVQGGERAQEFEFTLETLSQSDQGWGVARRQLNCESCGAVLTLAEGALTATCPFCGSNHVNLCPAPSDTLRPRFLVPFKVQSDAVRKVAGQWLGKGWFHPAQLASSAVLDRFVGIYLPFWTFAASISSDWKAEVGYEHQERYYDAGDKSWKTRTVIRWRWEDGNVHISLADLLVSGSSRLSRHILGKIHPFNLQELVT